MAQGGFSCSKIGSRPIYNTVATCSPWKLRLYLIQLSKMVKQTMKYVLTYTVDWLPSVWTQFYFVRWMLDPELMTLCILGSELWMVCANFFFQTPLPPLSFSYAKKRKVIKHINYVKFFRVHYIKLCVIQSFQRNRHVWSQTHCVCLLLLQTNFLHSMGEGEKTTVT